MGISPNVGAVAQAHGGAESTDRSCQLFGLLTLPVDCAIVNMVPRGQPLMTGSLFDGARPFRVANQMG